MSPLPPKPIRRLISLPLITLVIVLAVILTPVAVPLLALTDLAQRNRQHRLVRFWFLVLSTALVEFGGAVLGNLALMRFGWRRDHPGWFAGNEKAQFWWVTHHLGNIRRFAGVEIEVDNPEECSIGNAIVLAHHTSHIDALLPAYLFGPHGGRHVQYTLKHTLQWLPGMDLVAGNLPNVWVNRRPEPGSPMFVEMEDLASTTDSETVTVIFPEGTFHTPERLQQGADRVAKNRPDLEPMVRGLKHCLPIRPGGVMALLRGAPDADIVIVGHAGLEYFGFVGEMVRNIPSSRPWTVHIWRFPRSEVPTSDEEALTWLTERWVEMDDWIEHQVSS